MSFCSEGKSLYAVVIGMGSWHSNCRIVNQNLEIHSNDLYVYSQELCRWWTWARSAWAWSNARAVRGRSRARAPSRGRVRSTRWAARAPIDPTARCRQTYTSLRSLRTPYLTPITRDYYLPGVTLKFKIMLDTAAVSRAENYILKYFRNVLSDVLSTPFQHTTHNTSLTSHNWI